MTVTLDSSAVLAVIFEEPGADLVVPLIRHATIGTVNLAEVVGKLVERGWSDEEVHGTLDRFRFSVAPFDRDAAFSAGFLRRETRRNGLSFGDRACLALALARNDRVLTADRAWAGLDIGVEIKVIR